MLQAVMLSFNLQDHPGSELDLGVETKGKPEAMISAKVGR